MAVPNNQDELEIGIGINDDDLDNDIRRVEQIILQAAKNISLSFEDNSKVTKVFNQNLLALEKTVVTLTRQYASLGRAGAAGFEDISDKQQTALLELTKVQEKLRSIDIEASKTGVKKSRLAELKKESKEVTEQLSLMVRDLLGLQQLDIVLKAKILPEVKETPIKLTSIEDASRQFNQIDKAILSYQEKFNRINKTEYEGDVGQNIKQRTQEQLQNLEKVRNQLEAIRHVPAGDNTTELTNLLEESKTLKPLLDQIDKELISINRTRLFANEVEKPAREKKEKAYTGDIDLENQLRAQNKSAFSFEKQLAALERDKSVEFTGFQKEVKESEKEVKALIARIEQLQRVSKKTNDRDIIEQLDLESKQLKRELGSVEERIIKLKRAQLASGSRKAESGYGVKDALGGIGDVLNIPGLGAGLGAAAAITAVSFALNKFADYGKLALDKTAELISSNRLLASSAIEAGIGVDELAQKNEKFAKLVGLSDVRAASTTAKIAQLTTRSQRPQDIDKLIRGFADIGAARGLNPNELETIVQQIITGQDEGYKKLGLANPSQLYQKYAKENKRSPESLTSVERSQIFQSEFLKKAELFNGSAEAKLNSLDGVIAKLYASFENLGFGIAKVVANAPDVGVLLNDITSGVKRLTGSLDELYAKANRGVLTESEIKEAAKPGFLSGLRKLLGAGALIGGKALSIVGILDSDAHSTGESITDFGANELNQNSQDLNEDVIRQRLNAQKKVDSDNRRIANERKIELAREIALEERRQQQGKEEKRFTDLFKKKRDNPDDVEQALREIENYSGPSRKTLDTNELENRVNQQFSKLKGDDFTKLGQQGLDSPEKIKTSFREQIKAEMEAALEVLNQPLFDEETKEKLIERGKQDLSNAVQKMYKRVLDDPHIKIQTVLEQIGKLEKDTRLFPEVQEALIRQAKEIQERMAKLSEELKRDTQNIFVESYAQSSGSPLIKALAEVEDAFERTQRKFAPFGKEFAKAMAGIAKDDALTKVNQILYQISDKALKYRQEAVRLEKTPETQRDGFSRRLETVEKTTEFIISDSRLARQANEDKFYAERYNPYNKDNTYLLEKFGYNGLDKLTDGFSGSGRQRNESPQDFARRSAEEKQAYFNTSLKIKDVNEEIKRLDSADYLNTGIYGKEARAKALLDRLPSRDELLPRLDSYGSTKEEAQTLLQERANAQQTLREANVKRFNDFLDNQRFIELNKKDADERLQNIERSGLKDREKLEQYLSVTGEIGSENLTPGQRQGRVSALNALAAIEESRKKEDTEKFTQISNTMKKVQEQLEAKGLKVDLGDQAITDITVTGSGTSVESRTRRAGQSDTNKEY